MVVIQNVPDMVKSLIINASAITSPAGKGPYVTFLDARVYLTWTAVEEVDVRVLRTNAPVILDGRASAVNMQIVPELLTVTTMVLAMTNTTLQFASAFLNG